MTSLSCPGALAIPASVQALIECNGLEPLVHYALDDLPNRLQQSDSTVVAAAYGYQDDDDPTQLLGDPACLPHRVDRHGSPVPWLSFCFGSSSLYIPWNHSLMCPACIFEVPPLCPLDSSSTTSCTSTSVGAPSGIGTGVMLMGRGSPGEVLRVYSATHSAIWRYIVWKHGRASTSVVAGYHPLRCRNASWTSPSLKLGFDSLSNSFGPCNAVGLERCPYHSLQVAAASTAQSASPTQHCPVGHQPPCLH